LGRFSLKILLSGGTGNIGKSAVQHLVQNGHNVTVIGRRSGISIDNAEYKKCDILDYKSLLVETRGFDTIVHLAGIPAPIMAPPEEIFQSNCTGTFNIYECAVHHGIKRVVSASSINAIGYNWGRFDFPINSFPIDEESQKITSDAYSFSKKIIEQIAQFYWRKNGISGICLRFPWVYPAVDEKYSFFKENIIKSRLEMDMLLSMTVENRKRLIQNMINDHNVFRFDRYNHPELLADKTSVKYSLMNFRSDFWAVIDERDSAQAIEKSVSSRYEGCHILSVNDSFNQTGIDTETLVEVFFPKPGSWSGVWKRRMKGPESLVSIERARELIGFEPEYSLQRFFVS